MLIILVLGGINLVYLANATPTATTSDTYGDSGTAGTDIRDITTSENQVVATFDDTTNAGLYVYVLFCDYDGGGTSDTNVFPSEGYGTTTLTWDISTQVSADGSAPMWIRIQVDDAARRSPRADYDEWPDSGEWFSDSDVFPEFPNVFPLTVFSLMTVIVLMVGINCWKSQRKKDEFCDSSGQTTHFR